MTGRPIRKTPKGTILCSQCNERKSTEGATYVRRWGCAHRDPVCAGCSAKRVRGLVVPLVPLSSLLMEAVQAHNDEVLGGNAGKRTCDVRLVDGRDCVRNAAVVVPTDRATPVGVCRLHEGVLAKRGGIALADGGCLAEIDGAYRWYADARVGVPS
jgi:hypothetical protein